MLLHVVEPAVPVDPTDYPVFPEGSRKHMRDPRIFIDNVENRYSAEFTRIEWLAAGGGVEPGPIQIDPGTVPGSLHNGRIELVKVRVCVIKPFGHGTNHQEFGLASSNPPHTYERKVYRGKYEER